jgi:Sulfotransferase domain
MFRSGSTWSYNVVRELLILKYGRDLTRTVVTDDLAGSLHDRQYDDFYVIAKGHLPTQATVGLIEGGCVQVVHTVRDPLDAIRSGMRAFSYPFESALNLITSGLQIASILDRTRQGAVIFYEDIEREPDVVVKSLADYLGVPVSISDIKDTVRKFNRETLRQFTDALAIDRESLSGDHNLVDIGFSFYDSETLLHRSHISAGDYSKDVVLTEEQKDSVLKTCAEYVDAEGRLRFRRSRFRQSVSSAESVTDSSSGFEVVQVPSKASSLRSLLKMLTGQQFE